VPQTAVVSALPLIQRDLDTSATSVAWLLTLPALVASASMPIFGRLGDMFGKKRIVLTMCLASLTGCLIDAMPVSLGPLLFGRALQGLGMATAAICFGIVRDELAPARRLTGYTVVSGMWGVGSAAGFAFGGLIVDALSFRSIFWVSIVLLGIAFAALLAFVPDSGVRAPARVDLLGAVLFVVGLSCLLLGVSQGGHWGWTNPRTGLLFVAGALTLVAWVVWELRVTAPMIDVRLFERPVVSTVNANSLLACGATFGLFFIIPAVAEAPVETGYGLGASATKASLYLVPMSITTLLGALATAPIIRRAGGKRCLIVGATLGAIGFLVLAFAQTSVWVIVVAVSCNGAAIGLVTAAAATLISLGVPHDQIGEANGMASTLRNVGGTLGVTVMAAVLAGSITATGYPSERGYTIAYAVGAVMEVLAVGAGLLLPDVREARLRAEAVVATEAVGS
jgi:MFS family permease